MSLILYARQPSIERSHNVFLQQKCVSDAMTAVDSSAGMLLTLRDVDALKLVAFDRASSISTSGSLLKTL